MREQSLLSGRERAFLEAVAEIIYCNQFLPERLELERRALGPDFHEGESVWSLRVESPETPRPNVLKITERTERLVEEVRQRLTRLGSVPEDVGQLYQGAVLYVLYYRYMSNYTAIFLARRGENSGPLKADFYRNFLRDWNYFLVLPGFATDLAGQSAHIFACFFHVQRAFFHIFTHIIGSSVSAARLRGAIWESIFTHDMRRYRRSLYDRMGDFSTLITGPSGTGKEIVARAIALSRYVPFDPVRKLFAEDPDEALHAINLAALPGTLIESELFGHRKGAFTGALQDRKGWLDTCPKLGSVFLDEIGELEPAIQVKLLRVIETRVFQPLGSTGSRRFAGKLIAATNRDLADEIAAGRFREDLYYRLCSDRIVTPALRDHLRESPEILPELVAFMANRVAGPEAEALTGEVLRWIEESLGTSYDWPGNYRELEQCVRNILVRRNYQPLVAARKPEDDLASAVRTGTLSADELLNRYCALIYRQTGSYEAAGRKLGMDRRTVKARAAKIEHT